MNSINAYFPVLLDFLVHKNIINFEMYNLNLEEIKQIIIILNNDYYFDVIEKYLKNSQIFKYRDK